MSLTSCLNKAQGFIDPAIEQDLLDRAKTLEGRGAQGQGAARQAVQEAIDLLTRQLRVATNRAQEVRQSAPRNQTETAEFQQWSHGAPLIKIGNKHQFQSGSPVVVESLHGTTNADLTEFRRDRANIESDFGAGFYASNTAEDVATNYANVDGPDLTRRVESLAERLEQEDEFDGDMEAARQEARKQLSQDAPNTLKLFMRFSNPAVLGGKGETYFDYNEAYDEETDEYGEPTGLLVDFVNALDEAGDGIDLSMHDLEQAKAAIFDAAEGDGIKFGDLAAIIKDKMIDSSSMENGDSAGSELLRQALEGAGFDGVIDTTVSDKFGPKVVRGGQVYDRAGGMKGMTKDTVHFIAFSPTQIKSALGNNGNFDPANKDITQSAPRSTWYSGLQQAIEGVPERLATMAAPQWRLWLDANAAKLGVKKEEVEWSGVKEFLDTKGKAKVTKDEIAGYLAADGVKIEETVLGTDVDWAVYDPMEREESYFGSEAEARQYARDNDIPSVEVFPKKDRGNPTKYADYTLPGGSNYREFLLTLPEKIKVNKLPPFETWFQDHYGKPLSEASDRLRGAAEAIYAEPLEQQKSSLYTSSHWDQKNVLAHIRVDDRVDSDGKRVLFINEVQSDWSADGRKKGFKETDNHQAERADIKAQMDTLGAAARKERESGDLDKSYAIAREISVLDDRLREIPTPTGVPVGPFVGDTKSYVALALKRAIKLAVDEGYDRVAMVTGEQAADFFDLSKQVQQITAAKNDNGTMQIFMRDTNGKNTDAGAFELSALPDVVGKELAEKIATQKKDYDIYEGVDLKVGGEGMRSYYNDLVPNVVRDVLKKLGGGKMEQIRLADSSFQAKNDNQDDQLVADLGIEIEGTRPLTQPGFTITPAMKEKAAGGMVMFSAPREAQGETAAFKTWSGGLPVASISAFPKKGGAVVQAYHATQADFDEFKDAGGMESHFGFHFGSTAQANKRIAEPRTGKMAPSGRVIPVYVRLKNPLRTRDAGTWQNPYSVWNAIEKGLGNKDPDPVDFFVTYGTPPNTKDQDSLLAWRKQTKGGLADYLRTKGYDGIIYKNQIEGVGDSVIAIDAEQIKSAIGNNGNFDGASGDITQSTIRDRIDQAINQPKVSIVGDNGRQYTPEQLAAMRQVGFQVETPSLKERAKALTQGLGKRLAQGVFDQFAPIKDLDQHAYLLTRLSKGASGAFESFLHGGKLKLSDGVYDFDDQNRGGVIDKLLTPLGGEHHDFLKWIAANRAERLLAEGKENLFTPDDIDALKTLADGQLAFDYTLQHGPRTGQTTRVRADAYADSLKTFNAFSDNIMDMAEQSGLIDGDARQFWEQEFYVPFYRVADEVDGGISGMGSKGSMVRQEAFKKLKGGKNMLNADLLDNTLMNWAHLLDASAKNRAAKATLEAAVNLGVAVEANEATVKQMGKSAKTAPVWFQDGGKTRHFIVEDPMLLTAISSLEYAGMRNPVMNAMSMFKHVLTVGVTASPFFKIRNLIRDSVQIIGVAPIGANPLSNVTQGWKLTDPKSDAYFRLLAGGGTIHFGSMLEGSEAKRIQKLVESGVDRSTILNDENAVQAFYRTKVTPLIDAYNELGNRGEGVNRAALYDQLIKQGVGHAEASLLARDTMDFSMAGSFTSIRFLTQILPFFNARLQGLFKLGKAAKEDPKRMALVTGAVAMASVALLAAYGDDEDWKKREDWDRQGFWWFKVGDTAFRIPKPFELGAVGTLAEHGFELMFDQEMTGKRFRSLTLKLLSDNLAMNPVPQAFKPLLDVYSNKDSFSGRPIETPSMEKLRPEYRFTDRTSMVARGASTALNSVTGLIGQDALSPVMIDSMLRGYFGWLGSFVVGSADMLARPLTEQPSQAKSDIWKVATGGILSDLRDAPSRYVSSMYEQAKELEQAYGTHRMLIKAGKTEEAAEFKEDYADQLGRYKSVENVKQAAAKLNARRREIERSDMNSIEKREALRRISIEQDKIAKLIR
jgi:hypothetical protein